MNAALIVSAIIMLVIELTGAAAASSDSIIIQQQQNHSFIALLTGHNVIPSVDTNATGTVKFQPNNSNINGLYYLINLTIFHNDVAIVDIYIGNNTVYGRI